MKAKPKQPEIPKGTTFTGWTTFNWGICHKRVFPTRKEAIQSLLDKRTAIPQTWNDIKGHMRVVKVKCTVIKYNHTKFKAD